jgi:glycerol uptake facilitator-like aquaporin
MSTDRPASNGKPWTADYASSASSNGASASTPNSGPSRLVVLGYITAFALPLLGLFLGIVIATRPSRAISRHGRWIVGLSLVAAVIWALVFLSGAATSPSNDMGY